MLLKRQVRKSKFDPLTDKVKLIVANPRYAQIRFQDGREDVVATRNLVPQVDKSKKIKHELIDHHRRAITDITMSWI